MHPVGRTSTATAAVAICAGLVLAQAPASARPLAQQAAAQVVTAAATGSAATSAAALLQAGSRGPQVQQWQALLNRLFRLGTVSGSTLAQDGVFGPATAQATRTVQTHLRLSPDGVVGPRTRSAVSSLGFASGVGGTNTSSDAHAGERRLRSGLRGTDVREWQRQLNIAIRLGRLNHARVSEDSVFGPQTRSATRVLQRTVEVTPDGIVGPLTREATGWLLEG